MWMEYVNQQYMSTTLHIHMHRLFAHHFAEFIGQPLHHHTKTFQFLEHGSQSLTWKATNHQQIYIG